MKRLKRRVVYLWERYNRHINTGGLVIGFFFDLYLATSPASIANNALLLGYLVISAGCIMLLNARRKVISDGGRSTEPLILLFVLQFCHGGLASNLAILYGMSGTVSSSLLFIGLLGCLLVGNELLRSRYALLRFNIGVYYTLLLTYIVIATPTFIFHSIGGVEFVASTIISLVVMGAFLFLLYSTVLRVSERSVQVREAAGIVLAIFVLFNTLYFSGLIPPVPLSAKNIGIYHSLSRDTAGNYPVTYEPPAWFAFWRDTSTTYTHVAGRTAYCFAAIFAPGGLRTPITHTWELYDEDTKTWEIQSSTTFSMLGGRADGYRGYSSHSNLSAGEWRCNVQTSRGQLISRFSFTVVESSSTPTLSTTTL